MGKYENWKTVTLFISSTFSDMEAERDCIKKYVIPELEEFISPYHITIRTVDLRWGIRTDDQENTDLREAKILKVCFDEIDRSHPFFIGLLGARYGWVPSEDRLKLLLPKLDVGNFRTEMDIDLPSVTALEMFYGVLFKRDNLNRSLFCFRSDNAYSSIPEKMKSSYLEEERMNELNKLKKFIHTTYNESGLGDNIISYNPLWEGDHFTGLDDFRKQLIEKLKKEILEEVQTGDNVTIADWIEREIADQYDFIYRSTINFVGRDKVLSKIETELTTKKYTILSGESGTGKSSLLAKIYTNLQERFIGESFTDTILLFHSAGVTGLSGRMSNMLESFCKQIALAIGDEYQPIDYDAEMSSEEYKDFSSWVSTFKVEGEGKFASRNEIIVKNFTFLIKKAQEADKKIYMFIDAFDRFADDKGLSNMFWLPENIGLIISSLPQQAEQILKLPVGLNRLEIPDFDANDARKMIDSLCLGKAKELHQSVVESILTHSDNNGKLSYTSPLWMTLAASTLFTLDMDDFMKIRSRDEQDNEQKIENYMLELVRSFPADSGELFLFLVDRAAEDFGKDITYGVMRYIATSRKGLRETDLADLLGDRWNELSFASLRRWFRPFFAESGMNKQWNITHQLLKDKLNEKFIDSSTDTHKDIFSRLSKLEPDDPLTITELLYHVIYAKEDIIHMYTYRCRLPMAIREATYVLVAELTSNPLLVDQLIVEINHMAETGKSTQDAYNAALKILRQQLQKDGQGAPEGMNRNTKQESSNRHMLDRVIRSLCSQLMRVGRNDIALSLLKAVEPVVEESIEDYVIIDILSPLLYKYLRDIYEQAYDKENAQLYEKKRIELYKKKSDHEEPENFKYFEAINELGYEYDNFSLPEKLKRAHAIISGYDPDNWNGDWLDNRAENILAGIVACISLIINPEEENSVDYKEFLVEFYEETLELKEKGGLAENYKAEKLITYPNYRYRAKAMAVLMESAAKDFASIHEDLAGEIADESSEIFRQLYMIEPNANTMFALSTSFQARGDLFEKLDRTKETLDSFLLARQVAEDMLKKYPDLEDSKLRIMSVSRKLGEFVFIRNGYEDAHLLFQNYKKWALHLYENNPGRTQWLSSLTTACHWVAKSLDALEKVEEAAKEYKLCCEMAYDLFDKTKSANILYLMADIYADYSYSCMRQENWQESIKYISKAKHMIDTLSHNKFKRDALFDRVEKLFYAYHNPESPLNDDSL